MDLGTLGGHVAAAFAINNAGQVVGDAEAADGNIHAFLYSGGVMFDLNELIADLLAQAKANLPQGRIRTLAYDKAADAVKVHELLHDEHVQPVIQNRTFPRAEPEKVLGGRTPLNVIRDQAGTIYCSDQVSAPPVRHQLAYIGHEPQRGTLK